MIVAQQPFTIAGQQFTSRLLIGTAGYPNQRIMVDAVAASGAEIVTLSLRRISLAGHGSDTAQLLSDYRFLPNTTMSTREVWRGGVIAAIAFEISIQILPTFIAEDRGGALISAFAGAFIVLLWFYLMAFILLVGGVYNWWWREKRLRAAADVPVGGA